jgi:hypothetical protein
MCDCLALAIDRRWKRDLRLVSPGALHERERPARRRTDRQGWLFGDGDKPGWELGINHLVEDLLLM